MAPVAKRRKLEQTAEITFDPEARQEYLTGFHKRKQQRKENAREIAMKREKEEKVRERRQMREQRKEDLEKHIAEVKDELRKQNPDTTEDESAGETNGAENEWEGIEHGESDVAQDLEYVDEDKYTTVTVEAMGDTHESSEDESIKKITNTKTGRANGDPKVLKKRVGSKDSKAKSKKKKFRYESKAERQASRQKQKSKNHAAKLRREGK